MLLVAAMHTLSPWTWLLLGVLGALGILAMISPAQFAKLASRGGSWIDTNRILSALDKRFDIDEAVKPFSRVLGFAVLASTVLIAVLISR